jgi:hypothetical protein
MVCSFLDGFRKGEGRGVQVGLWVLKFNFKCKFEFVGRGASGVVIFCTGWCGYDSKI